MVMLRDATRFAHDHVPTSLLVGSGRSIQASAPTRPEPANTSALIYRPSAPITAASSLAPLPPGLLKVPNNKILENWMSFPASESTTPDLICSCYTNTILILLHIVLPMY